MTPHDSHPAAGGGGKPEAGKSGRRPRGAVFATATEAARGVLRALSKEGMSGAIPLAVVLLVLALLLALLALVSPVAPFVYPLF